MDRQLRQDERYKHDNPERWLRRLIRAGKLGPTNQAILGMLGYQPIVNIMEGNQQPSESHNYWFHKWHTEEQVKAEGMLGGIRGQNNIVYRPCIHRIYFYATQVLWMLVILKEVVGSNHRKDIEPWLEDLEHRQQFLGVLLKEL